MSGSLVTIQTKFFGSISKIDPVIAIFVIFLFVYPIPLTILYCTGNSGPVKVSWDFNFRFLIFSLFFMFRLNLFNIIFIFPTFSVKIFSYCSLIQLNCESDPISKNIEQIMGYCA